MWTTFVSNSDSATRYLQTIFSNAVDAHPVLIVAAVAGAMALVGTTWIVVLESELRQLRARMADQGRPIRMRR